MAIFEIQNRIKEAFPEWKTQAEQYKAEVAKHVFPQTTILDIGCGRTDYMCDLYEKANLAIGLDPDVDALNENPSIHMKIAGDFDALNTLDDCSVDLIVSSWTLEHLQNPDELFYQVQRLLKPGGRFISLTPNKYSLITTVSRLIPNKYHPGLVRKFWGRGENNTYPAFYKINCVKDIQRFADEYQLEVERVDFLKDPSYYTRNKKKIGTVFNLHKSFVPKGLSEGMLLILKK